MWPYHTKISFLERFERKALNYVLLVWLLHCGEFKFFGLGLYLSEESGPAKYSSKLPNIALHAYSTGVEPETLVIVAVPLRRHCMLVFHILSREGEAEGRRTTFTS